MKTITKLIDKVKGNLPLLIGSIALLLILVLAIAVAAGSILIFGLNLLGFVIPYTIKTMLGAVIVISCLRSMGSSESK